MQCQCTSRSHFRTNDQCTSPQKWNVRTTKGDWKLCNECTHAVAHGKHFVRILGQIEDTHFTTFDIPPDKLCSLCNTNHANFRKEYLERGEIKSDFICLMCISLLSRMGIKIPGSMLKE